MFPIKNRDMHEILMLYFTTYIHTPVKLYPVIKTMDFHLISYNYYMFNTTALNFYKLILWAVSSKGSPIPSYSIERYPSYPLSYRKSTISFNGTSPSPIIVP